MIAARDDIYDGNGFLEGSAHLRADIAYPFLNIPDALTAAPVASEEGHVAGVALRIVSADYAEQSRFSRTVTALESPFLASFHGQIDMVEYGSAGIRDAKVAQLNDIAIRAINAVWKAEYGIPSPGWEHRWKLRIAVAGSDELPHRNFGATAEILDGHDVGNQGRDFVAAGKEHQNLSAARFRQFPELGRE